MSSFLCFICHSTITKDTSEDFREKYREVVGMILCQDSHLCHICCHLLKKLWLFKSICLKRSLEYPVLFREVGALYLQRGGTKTITICSDSFCNSYNDKNIENNDDNNVYDDNCNDENDYCQLEDERTDFEDYINPITLNQDNIIHKNENININNVFDDLGHYNYNINNMNNSYNVNNDDCTETVQIVRNNDIANCINIEVNQQQSELNTFNTQTIEIDKQTNNFNKEEQGVIVEIENVEEQKKFISELDNGNEKLEIKKGKKKKKKKHFEKIVLSKEEQKMELEKMRKEEKYIEAEFKCYNCALGFLFKDTYQTHMMRHEESNGEYLCSLCTLRFASPSVHRVHCLSHSERYICTSCGQSTPPRGRQTHLRKCQMVKTEEITCHLCGRLFRDGSGLQQHLKRFHHKSSGRTYACNVCGKRYNNQGAVRTHMIKHINKKFACEYCFAEYSSPYTLNQHKKKHEVGSEYLEKTHHCSSCAVTFATRKSLLAHFRNTASHQLVG